MRAEYLSLVSGITFRRDEKAAHPHWRDAHRESLEEFVAGKWVYSQTRPLLSRVCRLAGRVSLSIWMYLTIDRAEASIGLPPRVLQIPPYHCCGPAFQLHPLRWTDKILCRFFGAPATLPCCARVFPDHLITYCGCRSRPAFPPDRRQEPAGGMSSLLRSVARVGCRVVARGRERWG